MFRFQTGGNSSPRRIRNDSGSALLLPRKAILDLLLLKYTNRRKDEAPEMGNEA